MGGRTEPRPGVTHPHVAVVGGGLAGCAAALACADAGARVTLLEARVRLGGATYSFEHNGLWFDNGQHVYLRCCTYYIEFIRRIGADWMVTLQPRLRIPVVHPERGVGWLRRARLPVPLHLAGSILSYPHLTRRERLSFARAVLALGRLDLNDASLDDRTFDEWLRKHGQSAQAIEGLWDLITLPTLNAPSRQASLWLAVKVFQTGLLSAAGAADIGYTTVPLGRAHGDQAAAALAEAGVDVRLNASATRITASPDGRVSVAQSGGMLDADAVIVAVPHQQVGSMLPAGAHPHASRFEELGAMPIVNLHVVYDRPVMPYSFAAGAGTPVQWVFDRTAHTGLTEGQCLAVSQSGAENIARLATDELRSRFLPELARLFPAAADAKVIDFTVTREHTATFRQTPGTRALRPGPTTNLPRVLLAGAWTDTGWPATMEGAVRSGVRAARESLLAIGQRRGLPGRVAA